MKPGTSDYAALHMWVIRRMGRAESCEVCEYKTKKGWTFDWANISGEYRRDTTDFVSLCRSCHRRWDGHDGLKRLYCPKGHEKKGSNLLLVIRKDRSAIEKACKQCRLNASMVANRKRRLTLRSAT